MISLVTLNNSVRSMHTPWVFMSSEECINRNKFPHMKNGKC